MGSLPWKDDGNSNEKPGLSWEMAGMAGNGCGFVVRFLAKN